MLDWTGGSYQAGSYSRDIHLEAVLNPQCIYAHGLPARQLCDRWAWDHRLSLWEKSALAPILHLQRPRSCIHVTGDYLRALWLFILLSRQIFLLLALHGVVYLTPPRHYPIPSHTLIAYSAPSLACCFTTSLLLSKGKPQSLNPSVRGPLHSLDLHNLGCTPSHPILLKTKQKTVNEGGGGGSEIWIHPLLWMRQHSTLRGISCFFTILSSWPCWSS